MRVKRYLAPNLPGAIAQVKAELGVDAVILHTRSVRQPGLAGLWRPRQVEVFAAVETKSQPTSAAKETAATQDPTWADFTTHWQQAQAALAQLQARYAAMAGPVLPGVLPRFYQTLTKRGLAPELAEKLLTTVSQAASEPVQVDDRTWVWRQLVQTFPRFCSIKGQIHPQRKRPYLVALVGATGVGKTTTLAKLAADLHFKQGLQIAFLTVDTYRIAAVEQLRVYADLLRVPLEVALSPEELGEAISKHQDKDVLLLDTAGRSPNNSAPLKELAAFLKVATPQETHLVLAANVAEAANRETITAFARVKYNRLLFTKLDEATSFGQLANLMHTAGQPVSYLAGGQGVPDDIEVATPERLQTLVLGEEELYA